MRKAFNETISNIDSLQRRLNALLWSFFYSDKNYFYTFWFQIYYF